VYDLHFGNPENVKEAIMALQKAPAEGEDRPSETVLILISSLLAWDKTPKKLQEIVTPEEGRRRAAELAAAEAKKKAEEESKEKQAEEGQMDMEDAEDEMDGYVSGDMEDKEDEHQE
jgi:hypothetical protein